MFQFFKGIRCFFFGFFVVCNAAVVSIAVWNHSLPLSAIGSSQSQIDIYLAFIACLGLVLIVPLIFIELAQKNWVTGRIWFECLWVGLFWMLYLAGAIAVSIASGHMCEISDDGCTSSRAIIAFTWITAVILLLYFSLLSTWSLIHIKHDPRIWQRYIRKSPWSGSLSSAPASPVRPHFLNKAPTIVAPKPRRVVAPAVYAYRSGLGLEYEIEHYHPPSPIIRPEPGLAVVPVLTHPSSNLQATNTTTPSLYPQFMHSTITIPTPSHDFQHIGAPASPPPLGDWPRPNVVMEPVRSKKKPSALVPTDASTSGDIYTRHPLGPRSSAGRTYPVPNR